MSRPVADRLEAMILVEVNDFNVAVRRTFQQTPSEDHGERRLHASGEAEGERVEQGPPGIKGRRAHRGRGRGVPLDAVSSELAVTPDTAGSSRADEHSQLRPNEMRFMGISDAGGVDGLTDGNGPDGMIEDPVQSSWLVLASDRLPAHDEHLRESVLSWRSTKLKRRVTSTLASETLAQVIQPFTCLLRYGSELAGQQQQCGVTDAKSLYDALVKGHPARWDEM
eukprot:s3427_g7.t1